MDAWSSGLCRSPLWHRVARFFRHPRANGRVLVFEIFRLEQYKSYVGLRLCFLWGKKIKLWITCTEVIDTCACKGKEGFRRWRASRKRADVFRNTHARAAWPIKTWSGETSQSLTETRAGVQKGRCRRICALAGAVCPPSDPAGGRRPLGLPREGEWSVLWGGRDGGSSPLSVGGSAAGLQPGPPSSILPLDMGGILAAENIFVCQGEHLQEGWIKGPW